VRSTGRTRQLSPRAAREFLEKNKRLLLFVGQFTKQGDQLARGVSYQATIHRGVGWGTAAIRLLLPSITFAQGTSPSPAALVREVQRVIVAVFGHSNRRKTERIFISRTGLEKLRANGFTLINKENNVC
jgi:hypothetical protein